VAQITLNIPDSQIGLVVDALADLGGYDANEDGPKPAFAKSVLITRVKEVVRLYLAKQQSDDIDVT